MSYVVEVFFKGAPQPYSRLFGVFLSAEQAQVFALVAMLKSEDTMDYAIRPLERVS